jgi:uncharacterized protein YdhG (YjbR/CyaY superfamily)
MKKHETYEEYCLDFSEEIQIKMEDLKNFIQKILPETTLEIKYGIPIFVQKGKNMIHFGAFKNHFGLYPGAEAKRLLKKNFKITRLRKELFNFLLPKICLGI